VGERQPQYPVLPRLQEHFHFGSAQALGVLSCPLPVYNHFVSFRSIHLVAPLFFFFRQVTSSLGMIAHCSAASGASGQATSSHCDIYSGKYLVLFPWSIII
jgi:hypothetical protein